MIKVIVMSDSHGTLKNAKKVLKKERKYDMVIHCGDIIRQDEELKSMCDCPVVVVKGNGDFYSDFELEEIVTLENARIFVTHGHRYDVDWGISELLNEAKERKCNVVLYGHTHIPDISYMGNIIAMNPGSISLPRQINRKPTYGIMTIDDDGKIDATIKYVDD